MDANENTNITDVLWQRGILVSISIGLPTFQRRLVPKDLLLSEKEVDKNAIYLGHKEMVSKTAIADLTKLSGRARAVVAHHGTPFPLGNGYFVTFSALPTMLRELEEVKDEWNTSKSEFIDKYQTYCQQQEQVLDAQDITRAQNERNRREAQLLSGQASPEVLAVRRKEYDQEMQEWLDSQRVKNRDHRHTQQELSNLIYMRTKMFRVSSLEAMEEIQGGISAHQIREAQRAVATEISDWVKNACKDIHQVLGEKAQAALELLNKNGKLQPRNLSPLFEAFDAFRSAEFTGQSEFRATVDDIRRRFMVEANGSLDAAATANNVNANDTSRGNMKALLERIGNLAQEEVSALASSQSLGADTELRRVLDL